MLGFRRKYVGYWIVSRKVFGGRFQYICYQGQLDYIVLIDISYYYTLKHVCRNVSNVR